MDPLIPRNQADAVGPVWFAVYDSGGGPGAGVEGTEAGHGGEARPQQRSARSGTHPATNPSLRQLAGRAEELTLSCLCYATQVTAAKGFQILNEDELKEVITRTEA